MRNQTKILGIYLFIYLSFDTAKGGGVGLHNVFKHIHIHTYQNRNLFKKKNLYEKTRYLHVIQYDATQQNAR